MTLPFDNGAGKPMTRPLCVIIGPGEGLGRALAAKFTAQGFNLALVSRSEKNCAHAIEAVEKIQAPPVFSRRM